MSYNSDLANHKMIREFRPDGWPLTVKDLRVAARLERLNFIKEVAVFSKDRSVPTSERLAQIWAHRLTHHMQWIATSVLRTHEVPADSFDVLVFAMDKRIQVLISGDAPFKVLFDLMWHLRLAAKFQNRKVRFVFKPENLRPESLDLNVYIPTPFN